MMVRVTSAAAITQFSLLFPCILHCLGYQAVLVSSWLGLKAQVDVLLTCW